MGQSQPFAADAVLVRALADSFSSAADRLDRASDLEGYVAAVEAHRQLWDEMARAAPRLGGVFPDQLREFSLALAARVRHRLDDHEVEALIHIDRFMSATIARTCAGWAGRTTFELS
ncbi:MAG: hypothetical protein HY985_03430 [Magnetospirillum sp.]|nr:hypothetical protein [Magnetospirillum sp.]